MSILLDSRNEICTFAGLTSEEGKRNLDAKTTPKAMDEFRSSLLQFPTSHCHYKTALKTEEISYGIHREHGRNACLF